MQVSEARRHRTVDLAQDHGAAPAVGDDARLEVIGAEIDETADRALGPDRGRDDGLVQPVLGRDDEAVLRHVRGERQHGLGGVVRLDREDAAAEAARHRVRRHGFGLDMGRLHRPRDRQAAARDGGDMGLVPVDEDHRLAGPHEGRPERAADRARAPDEDRIRGAHDHGPSSSARVSATATSQIASISASGRS